MSIRSNLSPLTLNLCLPTSTLCPSLCFVVFPCTLNDSTDLSADPLSNGTEFSSAEDVRENLTRLLILMTKGSVSPRRAAVLAYVTNQLLHSHVVAEKESDQPQQIIFDLPRPKRD